MLCSRSKQILFTKATLNNNVQFRCFINARFVSKGCGIEGFWASLAKNRIEHSKMNSVRFILRDICVNKFWNAWTRSVNIANVVKRCRKDRGVREVIQCFRQTFLRPRRTLLLSATAAYKVRAEDEEKPGQPPSCSVSITDEDLEALLLEDVTELSKKTLFCAKCSQRLVIDKKHPGIKYCLCKDTQPPGTSEEGWSPYMEAEDVIIWRKEYKPGLGLYAYKVYGRYKDVQAADFAAVQVDGAYRRAWDAAVASLSVVEPSANGVPDQAVLHWEVLWPVSFAGCRLGTNTVPDILRQHKCVVEGYWSQLFENRDYVYIRRHKQYELDTPASPQVFAEVAAAPPDTQRPSVHSHAKRKSLEASNQEVPSAKTNKVYVIISRSCCHPEVPATARAIRVSEYWSHMVVRTLHGADQVGMEFVLTYYDEPAVGGLPSGMAAWATGRAAPTYLARMRVAAKEYNDYRKVHEQDVPDFTPFLPEKKPYVEGEESTVTSVDVSEEDIESSRTDPEVDNGHTETETRDEATQTDEPRDLEVKVKVTEDKAVNTIDVQSTIKADKEEKFQEEDVNSDGGRWRLLYPFYYFI